MRPTDFREANKNEKRILRQRARGRKKRAWFSSKLNVCDVCVCVRTRRFYMFRLIYSYWCYCCNIFTQKYTFNQVHTAHTKARMSGRTQKWASSKKSKIVNDSNMHKWTLGHRFSLGPYCGVGALDSKEGVIFENWSSKRDFCSKTSLIFQIYRTADDRFGHLKKRHLNSTKILRNFETETHFCLDFALKWRMFHEISRDVSLR